MKQLVWLLAAMSSHALAQIRVGMTEVDITPLSPQILGGYGTYFLKDSLRISQGVHDPLFAGAIALQSGSGSVIVMATADLVGLSPAIRNRIIARTRTCGSPKLFLSATHTHHGPDVVGLWGPLPRTGRNEDYIKFLETKIASAVCEAVTNLEPAKISFASTTLTPDSVLPETDDQLSYLKIENLKGKLIGTVTQWGAHPTILSQKNTMISADFPGAYRAYKKKSSSGVHLYFSGTLGGTYREKDLSPIEDIFPNGKRSPGEDPKNYEFQSSQGKRLFDKTQQLFPLDVGQGEIKATTLSLRSPNKNLLFSVGFGFRVLEKRPEMRHAGDSDSIVTEVSIIQMGSLAIATLPGEAFPTVTHRIRQYLMTLNFPHSMIFGITNDWLGYVIDPDDYEKEEVKYFKTLALGPELAREIYSKVESSSK